MRIISTKDEAVNRLKFLIFGKPGVGKTYLAKTISEPTLLISAEAGHLVLADSEIDMIDISVDDDGNILPKEKRFDQLQKVYKYLLTDEARNKYKWIFFDSITEVSENLIESLMAKPEFSAKKMALPMWGEYAKSMRSLIKAFRDLPYYNVVFTAISEEIPATEEGGEKHVGVMVKGKISQSIGMFFDEMFYLGVRSTQDGDERLLLTSSQSHIPAKDRSGKLDKYEKPNLANIASKIRGEKECQ